MSGPANIGEEMKRGMSVLSAATGAYAQSRARHVIILTSDGNPAALDADRAIHYAREASAAA
jgi:nitric oxide reductase activation protein